MSAVRPTGSSGAGEVVGRSILGGEAEGELLGANEPLSFWGGYDSETGEIIDRRHALAGAIARGRILGIPETRGSSTTTAVLLEAIRRGTAPAAVITRGEDRFLALAAIVASELYDVTLPIVAVEAEAFERVLAASRVALDAEGRIRLA